MSAELAAAGDPRATSARRPTSCSSSGTPSRIAAASIGQVHRAVVVDPATGLGARRRREGAVPGRRRGGGHRPEERRPARPAPAAGLRRARPRRHGRRDQGAPHRGARLPTRGRATSSASPTTTAATRSSTCPRCCPRSAAPHVITSELVTGATWQEMLTWPQHERDLVGETPVPVRVPQPLRHARLQRRPAPGQLPVPRRRQGHVPRLRSGEALHRRRDAHVHRHGEGRRVRARRRRRSGASSSTPACSARAARSPDDEVGEYFSQFYESVRDDREVTWSERVREPASCATRSTAPAPSPSTPPCRRRSCSSSASTSASTPCSASCSATGNYRRMAEELWPFVQGPPSTPLARAEQHWLRDTRRGRPPVASLRMRRALAPGHSSSSSSSSRAPARACGDDSTAAGPTTPQHRHRCAVRRHHAGRPPTATDSVAKPEVDACPTRRPPTAETGESPTSPIGHRAGEGRARGRHGRRALRRRAFAPTAPSSTTATTAASRSRCRSARSGHRRLGPGPRRRAGRAAAASSTSRPTSPTASRAAATSSSPATPSTFVVDVRRRPAGTDPADAARHHGRAAPPTSTSRPSTDLVVGDGRRLRATATSSPSRSSLFRADTGELLNSTWESGQLQSCSTTTDSNTLPGHHRRWRRA